MAEVVAEGVTDEFAWYELSLLKADALNLANRLENMLSILKARAEEKDKYYTNLLFEMDKLVKENKELRLEVSRA